MFAVVVGGGGVVEVAVAGPHHVCMLMAAYWVVTVYRLREW